MNNLYIILIVFDVSANFKLFKNELYRLYIAKKKFTIRVNSIFKDKTRRIGTHTHYLCDKFFFSISVHVTMIKHIFYGICVKLLANGQNFSLISVQPRL